MPYLRSIVLLLLTSVLFSSCCFWGGNSCSTPTPEDDLVPGSSDVDMVNKSELIYTIQQYLPYARHAKHLRLENAEICYSDTINTVRMEFTSMDVMEMCEGRDLLVDLVEGLLVALNRNAALAPHFIEYPLTARDLEIYIDFESFHITYVDPYFLGYIMLENGIATYYAGDTKYDGKNLWNFRVEPYEKSRELTIFEREAEKRFRETIDMTQPHMLEKEQWHPPEKCVPRFFNPYERDCLFEEHIRAEA